MRATTQRNRPAEPTVGHRGKLLLALSSAVLAFLLLEVAARVFLYRFASDEQKLFYASLEQLQRMEGVKPRFSPHRYLGYCLTPGYEKGRNRHNSFGFRGEEIGQHKRPGTFRIVCLGGSTTYSDGVDDYRESFPFLLQRELGDQPTKVEVINAGVPGYGSLESLLSLELRLLDFAPDLIVVYHGINDTGARLVWPPAAFRGDNSGFNGVSFGDRDRSVLERSTLLRMVATRLGWIEPQASLHAWLGAQPETSYRVEYSRQVAAGSYPEGIFAQVPATAMFAANGPRYFRRNLEHISAVAALHDARVLFLTFATSAAPGWSGVIARPEFRAALAEMNEVQKEVARARGDHLLDLAAELPDDPALYVDGYHFTARGNRRRAELVGAEVRRLIAELPGGDAPYRSAPPRPPAGS